MDEPLTRILIREIDNEVLKMYDPNSPDFFLSRPSHYQQYNGFYFRINDLQGLFQDTTNNRWIVLYNNTASNHDWKKSQQEAEKYATKWSTVYDSIALFFSEEPGGISLDTLYADQIDGIIT